MLEINDELMTPGCPQCAIKHLSAALSYRSELYAELRHLPDKVRHEDCGTICAARAFINLGEVLIGYKSHLWYAVGLLQRAEEAYLVSGMGSETAVASTRRARLLLEEAGAGGVYKAAGELSWVRQYPETMVLAHIEEAYRELPGLSPSWGDLHALIESVHKEFFGTEEAPAASTEDAEKGGETKMATKKAAAKAPAKKADAKAVQAACKGGKCKGKKCK